MQHSILSRAFAIAIGLTAGCTTPEVTVDKDAITVVNPEPTAHETVRTEIKETAQAMKDYSYTQKTKFISETRRELTEIQSELEQFADGIDQSEGQAKADAQARLDTVREKLTLVKTRLGQAENATEVTWNDVRPALQKSRDELKESLENSWEWLSDKIKP